MDAENHLMVASASLTSKVKTKMYLNKASENCDKNNCLFQ